MVTAAAASAAPGCDLADNVALNKPAKASSQQTAANSAAAAFDGNATTRWESQYSDPQWLQVDLGSSQGICSVTIAWQNAHATAFTLETSENSQDWTPIYSTTTGPGGTQVIAATASGRFLRMTGTKRSGPYGYSIFELSVFSSGPDGNDQPLVQPPCVAGRAGTAVPPAPDFGPNVAIFDEGMPIADINAKLAAISTAGEFSDQRNAAFFLPGTYGCPGGADVSTTINAEVGYYTSIAGLGGSPDDVTINGALHVDATQVNAAAPWDTPQPGSLDLFWRSLSNVKINPLQYPVGADALRPNPEGKANAGTMRWAVSQAAPLRRVDIQGNLSLFGAYGAAASGGYLAESRITGSITPGSQQQFYLRDSRIGSAGNGVWNMVYSGVQGAPAQNFTTGTKVTGPTTTLPATPVSRDAPFLYIDGGQYAVFAPSPRTDASGENWSTDPASGRSVPISDFYIAKPDQDTAQTINSALASGKHLILTPGVYSLDAPIEVTNADTIVLGMGEATLVPTAGTSALEIGDVAGVNVSGIVVDAGATSSPTLLKVGPADASASDPSDPTALHDVFVRVGGPHPGKTETAIQVNSDNVLLDGIWSWRADHGAGTGWAGNTADTGLEVNGDNVSALGLAVEHYQKNQVIWNGDGGTTIFYQSELPYDVPSQSEWMDGSRNGYASYRVADDVTSHAAYGLGIYSFFNRGVDIQEDSAIQAPKTPGVAFTDMVSVFLGGSGSIAHVINDAGGTARSGSITQYLQSYPPAGTVTTAVALNSEPGAPAASGWYTVPVSLTAAVVGDTAADLTVSVDGGPSRPLTGPLTIGDGSHTVAVTARDAGGAFEASETWTGKVDATAPTATAQLNPDSTISLAGDDTGSGLAAIEYSVGDSVTGDGGPWTPYTGPVRVTGTHVVSYRATDVAGNISVIGVVDVAPTLTLDTLSVEAGGAVTATGAFLPAGGYTLELHSQPVRVAVADADDGGGLAVTFTVPVDTVAGGHTVHLLDSAGATVATAELVVTTAAGDDAGSDTSGTSGASGTTGSDGTTSAEALATTGADAGGAVLAMLLLLGAGGVLLVVRRRPIQ